MIHHGAARRKNSTARGIIVEQEILNIVNGEGKPVDFWRFAGRSVTAKVEQSELDRLTIPKSIIGLWLRL
jgi:hypothetical protein